MNFRNLPARHRPCAAGLLCGVLLALLSPSASRAGFQPGNARLLTTEAAMAIEHPVLGLQRSALNLPAGLALDTSLYADLLLAPNLGLRWALAAGPHRLVFGARYTHFMGKSVYSAIVEDQEPAIQRFEPELSGPTAYGAYGLVLGPLLIQGEARYSHYETDYATVTGAVAYNFFGAWALVGEVGMLLTGDSSLRAAGGVRYGGENFGLALGAAYVDLSDPMLPDESLSVVPVLDLSWTFR